MITSQSERGVNGRRMEQHAIIDTQKLFWRATVVLGFVGPLVVVWNFEDWWELDSLLGFLFGFFLALGASSTSPRTVMRWARAAVIGLLAIPMARVFDGVILPIVFLAAGIGATGMPPEFRGHHRTIKQGISAVGRAVVMLLAGYFAVTHFPDASGESHAEGTQIVSNRPLFLALTYSVILAAIAYDVILFLIKRELNLWDEADSRPNRERQEKNVRPQAGGRPGGWAG